MSKILVIEDGEAVRANLVELLDAEGFQVMQAADSLSGVRLVGKHLPDVILCDIMMPGLDGYGVLDALRLDPATAKLPFVFLRAKADRSDIRQGMNLGADDYIKAIHAGRVTPGPVHAPGQASRPGTKFGPGSMSCAAASLWRCRTKCARR